jgi:hypothetical protein
MDDFDTSLVSMRVHQRVESRVIAFTHDHCGPESELGERGG